MLPREARWLAARLGELPDPGPVLDVGSGTREFRVATQPWIDRDVFAPLRTAGQRVVHHDIRAGPGIDLVGDLADPGFLAGLAASGFRTIVCANVLECLVEPRPVAAGLAAAAPAGGHLLVTAPRRLPYSPDPLDTMFRPTVDELAGMFPGTELIGGEEIPAGTLARTYAARVVRSPALLRRSLGHDGAAGVPGGPPRPKLDTLKWLLRPLVVTGVVLRRTG